MEKIGLFHHSLANSSYSNVFSLGWVFYFVNAVLLVLCIFFRWAFGDIVVDLGSGAWMVDEMYVLRSSPAELLLSSVAARLAPPYERMHGFPAVFMDSLVLIARKKLCLL